jgi:cytoskeletal protein CcmA (bactofilin family)
MDNPEQTDEIDVDVDAGEDPWTHVAEDTRIDGDVSSGSGLVVQGEIIGDVTSARDIEVAQAAWINGAVQGNDIVVAGRIEGQVTTTGRLLILASGSVVGDIQVKSILIEEGGTLKGRCRMQR